MARPKAPASLPFRRVRTLLFAGALAMLGCSDEAPVSGPGTMTATLAGPGGPEGAAVVELLGPGLAGITAVGGVDLYAEVDAKGARVVLIHATGGELAFVVAVPDTTEPPAWVVRQVAGPDDALRPDLSRYAVEFSR